MFLLMSVFQKNFKVSLYKSLILKVRSRLGAVNIKFNRIKKIYITLIIVFTLIMSYYYSNKINAKTHLFFYAVSIQPKYYVSLIINLVGRSV